LISLEFEEIYCPFSRDLKKVVKSEIKREKKKVIERFD